MKNIFFVDTHTGYHLLPTLLRQGAKRVSAEELWQNEYDMFYEFRSRAKEVHSGNLSDWDILFYMQHHGAKTRLLDWSESFGVALYFALLNYDARVSRPCIWLLNPYKLNEECHDSRDLYAPENLDSWDDEKDEWLSYADFLLEQEVEEGIEWKEPIALYPIRRVDRLTSQGGYFTIHGSDSRPLEVIVPARKQIMKKVDLPPAAVESAFLFLEQAGITHYTMFPDLDGLAKYLNRKYFNSPIS